MELIKPGKYDRAGSIVFDRPEVVLGIEHHPLSAIFKRGDIFLSENPMFLGKGINFVSSMYSVDRKSEYSHAGFFVDPSTILEASYTVSFSDFIIKYEDKGVLVGRHNEMTNDRYIKGLSKIEEHIGQIYPFHRLFLHFFNLAQFIHWDRMVCSELVAKFLFGADLRTYKYYGTTPDHLCDEINCSLNKSRTGPQYDVIFKGRIPINKYKRCHACGVNVFTTVDSFDCPICSTRNSLDSHAVFLPDLIKYNKSKE